MQAVLGVGSLLYFPKYHTLGKSILYVMGHHVLKAIIVILSIVLITFIKMPQREANLSLRFFFFKDFIMESNKLWVQSVLHKYLGVQIF